jgi:uncharacterized protein YijF (DUF1287 family)
MPKPANTLEKAKDKLPKDYQNIIIDMMADGASEEEIFLFIYKNIGKFSIKTWYKWKEEEEIIRETLKLGNYLALGWWKTQGRINLQNKDFNNTLFYMNMKNRFGWSDNQNINHTGTIEHVGIIRAPEKKKLDKPKTVKIGKQTAKDAEFIEKDTSHKLAK